jgi:hypothetical protein
MFVRLGPWGNRVATAVQALQILRLRENKIGDFGAAGFAAMARDHPALVELDLAANCIRRQGAIALASMLSTNSSLKKLILDFNGIGSQARHHLWLPQPQSQTIPRVSHDSHAWPYMRGSVATLQYLLTTPRVVLLHPNYVCLELFASCSSSFSHFPLPKPSHPKYVSNCLKQLVGGERTIVLWASSPA